MLAFKFQLCLSFFVPWSISVFPDLNCLPGGSTVKIMFLSVQTGSSICLKGCHGNKLTVVKKWIRKAKRTKVKVINPRNMLLQIDQGF